MKATFDLLPGIVSDETLYSTPGRWSDGDKVRFREARPEAIGGWTSYNATDLTGVCRNVLVWSDNYLKTNVAFGTHTKLQVEYGGTIYDITPAGLAEGYADSSTTPGGWGAGGWGLGYWGVGQLEAMARTWSFGTWGENLVGNPRGFPIYIWLNDTSAVAAEITQSPDSVNCILVPPDSRQIRAFGCTLVASGYGPSTIRACDPSDYTDWTPSSTNNAFEVTIEGGNPIVRALTFGDSDAIWTTEGVHMGTFVGGVQKYRVDKIAANHGLAGPNAACVHNRVAYWLTPDLRFHAWSYGGTPVEIPCPISSEFAANLDHDQIAKVVCNQIAKFGEIWWIYPGSGGENSHYVAFHIDESASAGTPVWSKGTLSRTAITDNGTLLYPLMIDEAGNSYLHEYGAIASAWYVTSSAQYLDKGEDRVFVSGIWPDVKDQGGTITVTLTGYDWPQDSTATTFGAYSLTASMNKYDFTAETRLMTVKYAGSVFARIGKPVFDVRPAGKF